MVDLLYPLTHVLNACMQSLIRTSITAQANACGQHFQPICQHRQPNSYRLPTFFFAPFFFWACFFLFSS